ncbi:Zn-ribbon domain-containing OB-fold protein [Nocardia sp. alder85J]|uniref:Zn-ribbon domain-containing OB-fold protein n=1 Tax=Nocardia sp. alder85J TaxID=2862949 RepID=UPI00224FCE02|nr:OB-fold domain-containing protein [Nocardia sp. alder85J]MCX4092360.1 OB-fold domain-containing protein [Nocardia sp. alder85J]
MTAAARENTALPQVFGVPVALPSGLDQPYHDGLAAHELRLQHCECGTWQWPPEVICHRCHRFDPGWRTAAPEGVLFSWTRVWHPAREELVTAVPYVVAVVELPAAGGIRLVGNLLLDDPGAGPITVGAVVRGEFADQQVGRRNYTLLQWRLVEGEDR